MQDVQRRTISSVIKKKTKHPICFTGAHEIKGKIGTLNCGICSPWRLTVNTQDKDLDADVHENI